MGEAVDKRRWLRRRKAPAGLRAGSARTMSPSLACAALACAAAAAGAAAGQPQVELQPVVAGLHDPVCLTNAGDGSGRVFVCEQNGRVRVVTSGVLQPVPFLDIAARSSCCGERGLLSVAFPPGFASSGRFYVNYTDNSGDTVVSRFRVGADPRTADPDSEEVILRIDQPFSNHNGGQIAFGPDGYLYVGMGDGGSGGDPGNRAQNPADLLGKMLRIDVESGAEPYAVPADNPFAARAGYRPEIWALGLRNPWRFSFDRLTGDLWIGDVGQGSWEEIDFQAASSGGGENYGWRIMEGAHCYNPASCSAAGLALPVTEYDHSQGCSVTGGHVYRGAAFPRLLGRYFFADLCSGTMWTLRRDGGAWATEVALDTPHGITAFGEDEQGELYLADYSDGAIYRVTDTAPGCALGCIATVPATAPPGVAVELAGSAVTASCSEPVTFEWELGDGSPNATGAAVSHAWAAGGTFAWRLVARAGDASCAASGAITVRSRLRRALRSELVKKPLHKL
jgi:glucose/arabinose dehydrogenase